MALVAAADPEHSIPSVSHPSVPVSLAPLLPLQMRLCWVGCIMAMRGCRCFTALAWGHKFSSRMGENKEALCTGWWDGSGVANHSKLGLSALSPHTGGARPPCSTTTEGFRCTEVMGVTSTCDGWGRPGLVKPKLHVLMQGSSLPTWKIQAWEIQEDTMSEGPLSRGHLQCWGCSRGWGDQEDPDLLFRGWQNKRTPMAGG